MSVMKIEILGTGCSKCHALERSVREAIERFGLAAEVSKVEAIEEIVRRGVLMTPALVVDGTVKSSGRVLSADDVRKLLQ
jgi:small redox-active disulfide protein 2